MSENPDIVFIIPLASARSVRNWPQTCALLRQTVRSIFNSASGNFRVVVTGHERPDGELPGNERFQFLSLDQPLPPEIGATYFDKVQDKMAKLHAAWEYAKTAWSPRYVMKLDADDLISARLAGWLATAPDEAGFCVKQGWHWRSDSRWIVAADKFDELCGSCLIIRSDLADLTGPFFINSAEEKWRIVDHHSLVPGARTSTLLLNDCHHRAAAQFRHLGYRLAEVPFRAAVYRTGIGFSLTDQRHVMEERAATGRKIHSLRWLLGRIRRTQPVTARLRREFMLE